MDRALVWTSRWRRGGRVVGVVALAYVALLLVGLFASDKALFLERPARYRDTTAILKLRTANGAQISARYLPYPGARYTILFSHGAGDDLGREEAFLQSLHDHGYNVLAYDYQGYGTSEGTPSVAHAIHDINAAYAYLTEARQIPPSRIILQGRSLGGGPSCDLACRAPVAGLILESTYTSVFRVMTQLPILPFDKFRTQARLREVGCPVLVIHGTSDVNVLYFHGLALYLSAQAPKQCYWVRGAGHNNLRERTGEEYFAALTRFTRLIETPTAPAATD